MKKSSIEIVSPNDESFNVFFDSKSGEVKIEGQFISIEAFLASMVLLSKELNEKELSEEKNNSQSVNLSESMNNTPLQNTSVERVYEIEGKKYILINNNLVSLESLENPSTVPSLTNEVIEESVLDNTIRKPHNIGGNIMMLTDHERSLIDKPNQTVEKIPRPQLPSINMNDSQSLLSHLGLI